MAITKYIQKNTHLEAIVKVVNEGGAGSIDIQLIADLLRSNEELITGVPPKVFISEIQASIQNTSKVRIVRSGVLVGLIFENASVINNEFSADREHSEADIHLDFTGEGMVTFRLLKTQGYNPKVRQEQNVY